MHSRVRSTKLTVPWVRGPDGGSPGPRTKEVSQNLTGFRSWKDPGLIFSRLLQGPKKGFAQDHKESRGRAGLQPRAAPGPPGTPQLGQGWLDTFLNSFQQPSRWSRPTHPRVEHSCWILFSREGMVTWRIPQSPNSFSPSLGPAAGRGLPRRRGLPALGATASLRGSRPRPQRADVVGAFGRT